MPVFKRFKERVKGPLVDPLYSKNLVGEASTSGVLTMVFATTALVVMNVNSIEPISVTNYEVLDAEPQLEASHSPKVLKRKSWTLHEITLRPVEPAIYYDASC
nr:hypothetical protein [Tanacetum cinerariifolium]